MNKRTKKIFKKKQNWKPLIYACGCFAFLLLIWIMVINSGSDEPSPGTLAGIKKDKQAVEDLRQEVYTQEPVEDGDLMVVGVIAETQVETVGYFLQDTAPGVGAFIVILGVFGAVAAIVFAVVGVVRNRIF